MLINKYQQVLRTAMNSKFVMKQSAQLPKVVQVVIKVKAENVYDPITNVSLVTMLSGVLPQSMLVNMKKGTLLPFVTLSNHKWSNFMESLLPVILNRLADKVVAATYASISNSVNFTFKASDAMPFVARKLWKLFETEIGAFNLDITFKTNVFNVVMNETILRVYQIPVVIKS
jgi:ribosomal protein L5